MLKCTFYVFYKVLSPQPPFLLLLFLLFFRVKLRWLRFRVKYFIYIHYKLGCGTNIKLKTIKVMAKYKYGLYL